MNNIEQLRQLSNELNLSFESQDWGIVNSSAERVGEFINYFETKESLQEVMKYHVFELIIASFNDALLEGEYDANLKADFTEFLNRNSRNEILKPIIDYWKNISGDEYPVSKFL